MASRKQTNKTWEELESVKRELVDNIFPTIQETKKELDSYRSELLVGSDEAPSVRGKIIDLEAKIAQLKDQATQYVSQILELHNSVFGDSSGEQNAIKGKLEIFLNNSQKLFSETENKKEEFDAFYKKIFGVKDESGQLQGGLSTELEKYKDKYETLFANIETLLPGATSAGLSEVFANKVAEYTKSEKNWSKLFLALAVALAIYFGIDALRTAPSTDLTGALLKLIHKLPFLLFAIWLIVFVGNRRAENKKLEEAYKHKETMSRSYVGYKENIEDLEDNAEDKTLLKTHMQNLLDAIKEDSGKFLNEQGDKHPLLEALFAWLSRRSNKARDEN